MGNFLYGGKKPASIKYNGASVQVLKYNGVVVWQAMDSYVITGKLIGKGTRHSWDCNCETNDCHSEQNCNCNCSNSGDDYEYSLQLTFSGVSRFPIKYVSKSGATVSIEKSAVSGSGSTYTYTSGTFNVNQPSMTGKNCSESFDMNSGIEELKSIYPASGLSSYSSIASINITAQNNGVSDCVSESNNCQDCNN
ncbi:hypothetical protein ACTQV0_12805 [Selenomonas montiformis]|uniref:hypothetical protein n=1 Tax=Selenomonas montiformis TaxID=2652285 RepID=UPI003F8AC080